MRYGIFGGTFDPIHAGHVSMISGALESGLIDKLWVIPSGYPPQKDAHLMTLAPYRYFMTRSAVRNIPSCEVLPLEIIRPQISYTVDTLRAIRDEHIARPDDELFLIFGTDILFSIETWYHPEVLLQEARCMIAQRPGDVTEEILQQVRFLENKYHISIAFFPIKGVEISSSEIRSSRDDSKLLPAVRAFISKHNLYAADNPLSYLKENTHRQLFEYGAKLFKELSEKRMLHSMNVAMLSILYANRFGADPDEAAIAGLLHDCAKELPIPEQRNLARQTHDEAMPDDPLLHAPAGVVYAKEQYGIKSDEILSAIHYHTTGRGGMSVLEKIIFLADKLEPARNYDDLTEIRALADIDLDAATVACLQAVQSCMIKKDTVFHPEAVKALDSLLLTMNNMDTSPQPASLKEEKMDTLAISKEIVTILTNKKAVDVEWIPVAEKTTLADYFIVASGTSTTHIKALSDEVEFVLKNEWKIMPDHIEGLSTGRWVLLDYKDIIVHIFHPEERAHYSLEKLWLTKRPESESSSEEA
jgi:nicotinate-nucleotide adenylyltransferase